MWDSDDPEKSLEFFKRSFVADEDEIDLSNVAMSHYRLSKLRQQDIQLKADSTEHKLEPGNELGTAKPKDKKEDFLSQILSRMNDLFVTDNLTEKDMINYALTIADKMSENTRMMKQIHSCKFCLSAFKDLRPLPGTLCARQ